VKWCKWFVFSGFWLAQSSGTIFHRLPAAKNGGIAIFDLRKDRRAGSAGGRGAPGRVVLVVLVVVVVVLVLVLGARGARAGARAGAGAGCSSWVPVRGARPRCRCGVLVLVLVLVVLVLGACQRGRLVAWCGPMAGVGELKKHGKTPEVREARRLYLYGGGDGRRVLNVATLAEAAGCHAETVRRWLPTWEAEAESILTNTPENGLVMRLNAETLAKHESDCMKIRSCIDAQLAELERLPRLEKQLLSIAGACAKSQNDAGAAEAVLALVQSFIGLHGGRKAGELHLLKLQAHWSKMSGIESLQSVAETREKTLASGRAKLRLRAEEAQGQAGPDGARVIGSGGSAGGVFAKRVPAPAPVDVISDDEV